MQYWTRGSLRLCSLNWQKVVIPSSYTAAHQLGSHGQHSNFSLYGYFNWGHGQYSASSYVKASCALILGHHDDVIKLIYFQHHWSFAREIHRSPVDSPRKGQWRVALVFFYLCLNERFNKLSRRTWFETSPRLLFRHCNDGVFALCFVRLIHSARLLVLEPFVTHTQLFWDVGMYCGNQTEDLSEDE